MRAGRNQTAAGARLRGRERNGLAEERVWGAAHGGGGGSGHTLAEVTQWHHSGRKTPWRRGGRLHVANLRRHCGSRRRAADSPSGQFDFSGAQDPQSRAPNPRSYGLPCAAPPLPHLRPMREGATADVPVSRGRLARGDMANADRSSRPSLPYPPEVWPSQPARRSEPTRTRPTVFFFHTSPSIAPHFHTP